MKPDVFSKDFFLYFQFSILISKRGLIGPYLVSNGLAFGSSVPSSHPNWSGLMSYTSLSAEFTNPEHPSPRYWLLWPGVASMVAVAFTGKKTALAILRQHAKNLCFLTIRNGLPMAYILGSLPQFMEFIIVFCEFNERAGDKILTAW